MARKTLPLFLLLSLTIISGCGGNTSAPVNASPEVTITAAQVFSASMIGQTWPFHNGYGDITTISVESAPDGAAGFAGVNAIFHYRKNNARAYWNPGTPDAELWFVLHQQADGSWSSTASLINFPQSCAFCTSPPNWKTLTSDIRAIPGQPIPYGIIPASASTSAKTIIDTSYQSHTLFNGPEPDFSDVSISQPANPPLPWRNSFYIENVSTPVYSGPAIVSEQWEGPCFPIMQPGCAHEKWYFAPNLGMVKVVPINIGAGDNADPKLTMVRQIS